MKIQNLQPELISVAEAALKLSVSERTIARLIADGQLHAPKIRRRRLVSMVSIQGLLKGN
jgi:excisionase family DNA binding protein